MVKRIYNSSKPKDMDEALEKFRNKDIGFNETYRQYNIPKPTVRRHLQKLNKHNKFGR